jgi:hypothetical protein
VLAIGEPCSIDNDLLTLLCSLAGHFSPSVFSFQPATLSELVCFEVFSLHIVVGLNRGEGKAISCLQLATAKIGEKILLGILLQGMTVKSFITQQYIPNTLWNIWHICMMLYLCLSGDGSCVFHPSDYWYNNPSKVWRRNACGCITHYELLGCHHPLSIAKHTDIWVGSIFWLIGSVFYVRQYIGPGTWRFRTRILGEASFELTSMQNDHEHWSEMQLVQRPRANLTVDQDLHTVSIWKKESPWKDSLFQWLQLFETPTQKLNIILKNGRIQNADIKFYSIPRIKSLRQFR